MYDDFFKLQARPFLPAPQVDRYFPAQAIEAAHQKLLRCIERGEGAALLIGPAGTGKTLLCQMLDQAFRDSFAVVRLSSGHLATRQALLQAILYELGLPYRGMDEGELRLSLLDFLEPGGESKGGLLLLVDEAHTLPLRLLEELRMITNLVRDGQPRVRVALAGTPLLEERFASPKLSCFAQRLTARCYLQPLDASETAEYVRSQLRAVGGDADQLIDNEALRSIYRATDGIPRLINQVCDHALILASLGGADRLTGDAIEEAWADLQQIPTAWSAKPAAAAEGVIEFGDLEDTELPEAIPFRAAPARSLHVAPDSADAGDQPLGRNVGKPAAVNDHVTEIELDFPEFGDSSGEQFEEEEVVLDRYASDFEMFADVPRVSSWEGRQLGSMLDPLAGSSSGTRRPDPIPLAFHAARPKSEPSPRAPLAAASTASGESHAASLADQDAFWAGAKPSPQEPDLIVVEEDATPELAPPPQRREYRQLFAKLRRG